MKPRLNVSRGNFCPQHISSRDLDSIFRTMRDHILTTAYNQLRRLQLESELYTATLTLTASGTPAYAIIINRLARAPRAYSLLGPPH
jgi:hypothetical protein